MYDEQVAVIVIVGLDYCWTATVLGSIQINNFKQRKFLFIF